MRLLSSMILGLALCTAVAGQANAEAPAMSAEELLRFADQKSATFQDAYFHFKMSIKEPSGQVREVEFETWQKGNTKRLVRFLSPGDLKGMGFLSESEDVMYALLPAFGNRVRRLGTHQKSQSFMGSDLANEDMAAIALSSLFVAKMAGTEGPYTILDLSLRPGKQSEFSKLRVWIEPKDGVMPKIEYQGDSGKALRTQERLEFVEEPALHAKYPHKLVFTDHRRNNHQTELKLLDSKFNQGLGDDKFTQRALQRD